MRVDIVKSFAFIIEDERWKEKLAIGVGVILASAILSPVLIGILGYMIVAGYGIRLLQNVRDGVEQPLPEWDRWSGDLAAGFKLFVALLIYALPAIVLIFPFIVGGILSAQGDTIEAIGVLFMLAGICLIFVYGLLITLMTPGITIAFARDEQIASALRFNDIWLWTRANLGNVIIVTITYILASAVIGMVAPFVGVLLCVVGLLVTIPLSVLLPLLVQNHLYGQLAHAELAGATSASAAPVPPPSRESSPLDLEPETPVAPAAPVPPAASSDAPAAPSQTLDDAPTPPSPDDWPAPPQNPT